MAERLILDTNVLIELMRGGLPASIFGDSELAIAAITVGELVAGLSDGSKNAKPNLERKLLQTILKSADRLNYTAKTAEFHGRLLAQTRKAGRPRGYADLIIAAHAIETGRTLVSLDKAARFSELPGVNAVDLSYLSPRHCSTM